MEDKYIIWGFNNKFIRDEILAGGIKQLYITGIESHICIQQSVRDILNHGITVNVCGDAMVSCIVGKSENQFDNKVFLSEN